MPHLDAAYNLARWLARSPQDADDVVQEAMLRAFRAFDSFRGSDVKPWLLVIVRNCYITSVSGRRRSTTLSLESVDAGIVEPALVEEETPEAAAIEADHSRKLGELIALLPEDYREVLILREMEDMSYRDIASVTGIPIGTVMSRLSRARSELRQKWLGSVGRKCRDVS